MREEGAAAPINVRSRLTGEPQHSHAKVRTGKVAHTYAQAHIHTQASTMHLLKLLAIRHFDSPNSASITAVCRTQRH